MRTKDKAEPLSQMAIEEGMDFAEFQEQGKAEESFRKAGFKKGEIITINGSPWMILNFRAKLELKNRWSANEDQATPSDEEPEKADTAFREAYIAFRSHMNARKNYNMRHIAEIRNLLTGERREINLEEVAAESPDGSIKISIAERMRHAIERIRVALAITKTDI